ncbi:hypothetical protein CSC3H3_00520 [Thalassospira marina]|uniref:Uncharacterized protein n=1 Tax=Thalassospira marina TaxID=2048283 RepID=A0A2N3KSP1_9PROT|nr:hypothetical protein CSC3H3_00520 [Thalassospira marina]PKR53574.1 hypothetical protein COO20_13625 [Thalassospira marina]
MKFLHPQHFQMHGQVSLLPGKVTFVKYAICKDIFFAPVMHSQSQSCPGAMWQFFEIKLAACFPRIAVPGAHNFACKFHRGNFAIMHALRPIFFFVWKANE